MDGVGLAMAHWACVRIGELPDLQPEKKELSAQLRSVISERASGINGLFE